jgi:cytochrome c oxidase subunit 1/cytochrome c oxidase subunit I+III
MPRRVYTYADGLGWGSYNLAETVGAYLLTVGLLMIFANLAWSRFRGAASGPDPFRGGTLEWATTSPPPVYNFAVVPTVTSPYPNWDEADREQDRRRLQQGALVLDEGHETPSSTVRDGYLDGVLEMPEESWWPLVTAVCVTCVFAFVLVSHYAIAGVFLLLTAFAIVGWHMQEPAEEPALS